MSQEFALSRIYINEKAYEIYDLLDVSELTRTDYKYRIGLFLTFVTENGFGRTSFLEFKRYLASRDDIGTSTKNKNLAAARIYLRELNKLGVLPVDITMNVKGFRQSNQHRKDGFSEEEIARLAAWLAELEETPRNFRLKAMLSLLIFQGLRQIELCRLNVSDIDLIRKIAYVHGKGRDDVEAIYLHPTTVKALRAYLRSHQTVKGALFTSQSNSNLHARLSTRGLRSIIKPILLDLGTDKSLHCFRHYHATKLIKVYQGNLLDVAQLTRHKSLSMLTVYYDAIKREEDLPRYYEAFNDIKV